MASVDNVKPIREVWSADLIYAGGLFQPGTMICDDAGSIAGLKFTGDTSAGVQLKGRAVLPGLVNAHSHAFQRVIRGRTEHRTADAKDSFWTWRELMYTAARRLTPEDIYDASRMAFLEMALSGITAVGEFHYLHHAPDGRPYDDPNLLSKEVIRAAREVGLRIALLRVAYERSGHQTNVNPGQNRFLEPDHQAYLRRLADLKSYLANVRGEAWVGVAPHSLRGVSLDYAKEIIGFAIETGLQVHMHVAEQPAEVTACIEEYHRPPIALLESEGLLNERFTAVHAIHITPKAIPLLAQTGARVCACPTTERNLGDGTVPVDAFFEAGINVCLGSDSHIQIDLMEDARELEYHLRLQKMGRALLAPNESSRTGLAERLFACATIHGAGSIGAGGGRLEPGRPADFFTVDLNDPSIAGSPEEDLISSIVFALSKSAVKDVVVGGKQIVSEGRHFLQEEIVERFRALQKRLWGQSERLKQIVRNISRGRRL